MKPDKNEAAADALIAGTTALLKQVPLLAVLIEGLQKFEESMARQQRDALLRELLARQDRLEQVLGDPWFQTEEGQRVASKILATALNAEYSDKVEYLASALLNAPSAGSEARVLKFIETLRHISRPALLVLACQERIIRRSGPLASAQPHVPDLVVESGLEARIVESCIQELHSLGVFSSAIRMEPDGRVGTYLSGNEPAFTTFSAAFLAFVRAPRDEQNG